MSSAWCNVPLIGALLAMAVDTAHAQASGITQMWDAKMADQGIAYVLMLVALVLTYLIH